MGANPRDGVAAAGMRLPWVTCLIAALCLGVGLAVAGASRRAGELAERELREAAAYLHEHPYLEADPRLGSQIDPDGLSAKRQSFLARRARKGLPPMPRRVQARQQETLDELVAEALARVPESATQRWGVRANALAPVPLVTHVFFHSSWAHLAASALVFLLLGFYLEGAWGAVRFAMFVPVAGVAAAGAFVAADGDGAVWVGLQGVVAALLAAFAIQFAGGRLESSSYLFLAACGIAYFALPLWLGAQWGVVAVTGGAGVASHWALAGGAGAGALVGAVLRGLSASASSVAAETRDSGAQRLLAKVVAAHRAGLVDDAFALLANHLRSHPDDRDANLAMWDVASDLGRTREAAAAMIRVIRHDVQHDEAEAAVGSWLELRARGLEAQVEPGLLIRLAQMLREHGHGPEAGEALSAALARCTDDNASVVAPRIAREAVDLDRDVACKAAWRALACADLELGERQRLEELLDRVGPGKVAAKPLAFAPEPAVEESEVPVDDDGSWLDSGLSSPAPEAALASARLESIAFETLERSIQAVAAVPLEADQEALVIEADGGAKKRLPLARIEAISVAAIGGLAPRTVIVVDLILNWGASKDEPLKVIRVRGDRFDPRRFLPSSDSSLDALRGFITGLLSASNAVPLPDLASAQGLPFAAFDDLASYERSVLGATPGESS